MGAYTAYDCGTTTKANYAAKICADYIGFGFDDWFLPSKDELAKMFQVMSGGYLDRFSVDQYRSSSENDAILSWTIDAFGSARTPQRSWEERVRLIRAFK